MARLKVFDSIENLHAIPVSAEKENEDLLQEAREFINVQVRTLGEGTAFSDYRLDLIDRLGVALNAATS